MNLLQDVHAGGATVVVSTTPDSSNARAGRCISSTVAWRMIRSDWRWADFAQNRSIGALAERKLHLHDERQRRHRYTTFRVRSSYGKRKHCTGMASAIMTSRDIQVVCQRPNDKEPAAAFAQHVDWRARTIGKARTPIKRMKNGRITTDIEGKLHVVTAVPNDIAEKLAENELGEIHLRFPCSVLVQHPNDALPRFGSGARISHCKSPASVSL